MKNMVLAFLVGVLTAVVAQSQIPVEWVAVKLDFDDCVARKGRHCLKDDTRIYLGLGADGSVVGWQRNR